MSVGLVANAGNATTENQLLQGVHPGRYLGNAATNSSQPVIVSSICGALSSAVPMAKQMQSDMNQSSLNAVTRCTCDHCVAAAVFWLWPAALTANALASK